MPAMTAPVSPLRIFSPAKINLALHVTGRRADGYHLLDSLVAFLDLGDWLEIAESDGDSLTVEGPFANAVPVGGDNFVFRAAVLFHEAFFEGARRPAGLAIHLHKALPVASGLGGGTGNGAAVLRYLAGRHDIAPDDPRLVAAALRLGADGPMCLAAASCRARGIGDERERLQHPPLFMVVVNPGVAVETPPVFRALEKRDNPPIEGSSADFAAMLRGARNDLTTPAILVAPEIARVLEALEGEAEATLTRMSGSGATCFALTRTREAADRVAARLRAAHPGWWVRAAATL